MKKHKTMESWSFLYKGMVILISLVAMSCSKDGNDIVLSPDPPTPSAVKASAGADRNVLINGQISLNGTATGDGEISYTWKFTAKPSGSNATLSNADTKTPSFVPDVAGKYKIELTAAASTDDSDSITIAAFDVIDIPGNYANMLPGANVGIAKFAVAGDRLYATCEFSEIGNILAEKIACYDGNAWAALGCGLEDGNIFAMVEYQGDLYVTGSFEEIGCTAAKNIARWDGSGWNAVQGGLTGGDNPFGRALTVYKNELYVGGSFTMAGSINANNMAKWNGMEWSAVGSFENGSIFELQVYNQKLYAGGSFDRVDGTNTGSIASYNGGGWSALGSLNNLELQATGTINEMAVLNDVLYIAGFFNENGNTFSELITWDDSNFNDFGKAFSLNQNNTISELTVIDDILYIGGNFQNVVGSVAHSILQWDGNQWGIMANGVSGTVLSIEAFSGAVYVGGDFTTAGGANAENISIWSSN